MKDEENNYYQLIAIDTETYFIYAKILLDKLIDVVCKPRSGYLTQYLARHKGAFERFIEANDIILLENPEWGKKKEALAENML